MSKIKDIEVLTALLRKSAKLGKTQFYSHVAAVLGLNLNDKDQQDYLWDMLDEVSIKEHYEARPMLSAIVINKKYKIPGPGFFSLARNLGLLVATTRKAEIEFHEEELKRVIGHHAGSAVSQSKNDFQALSRVSTNRSKVLAGLIIAIPTLLVSLYIYHSQRDDALESNYNAFALSHRPELAITLRTMNVIPGLLKGKVLVDNTRRLITSSWEYSYGLRTEVTLKNIGKSRAVIQGYIGAFCPTTQDTIRSILLTPTLKTLFTEKGYTPFAGIERWELSPDSSFAFSLAQDSILVPDSARTVLHLLVLYENEYGVLYDSYCRELCELRLGPIQILSDSLNSTDGTYLMSLHKWTIDNALSTQPYNIKAKSLVLRNMQNYLKQAKQ